MVHILILYLYSLRYTSGNTSNMAVMDVALPSGYIIDNDLVPGECKC